jgi:hypothetical protein
MHGKVWFSGEGVKQRMIGNMLQGMEWKKASRNDLQKQIAPVSDG